MREIARLDKIMVLAAGNDRGNARSYPSEYIRDTAIRGFAIKVGALNQNGEGRARFSSTCGNVREYCLFAPGVDIESTVAGGDYDTDLEGTSFATPIVSGALAVLMAAFPAQIHAQSWLDYSIRPMI